MPTKFPKMNKRIKTLLVETRSAFRTPTLKQKEAYGRLSHTFSAASWIGAVTVLFTETNATLFVLSKIAALIIWGVVLFWLGAILSKGE